MPTPPSEKLFAVLRLFVIVKQQRRPPQTSTSITAVVVAGPVSPKPFSQENFPNALTVGLLESGTGTWTTELLGLAAAVVGDEEGTVELGQGLLQQVLGVLIDEPIVVWLVIGVFLRSSRGVVRTSGCRRSEPWRWLVAQRCSYVSMIPSEVHQGPQQMVSTIPIVPFPNGFEDRGNHRSRDVTY